MAAFCSFKSVVRPRQSSRRTKALRHQPVRLVEIPAHRAAAHVRHFPCLCEHVSAKFPGGPHDSNLWCGYRCARFRVLHVLHRDPDRSRHAGAGGAARVHLAAIASRPLHRALRRGGPRDGSRMSEYDGAPCVPCSLLASLLHPPTRQHKRKNLARATSASPSRERQGR